MKFIKTFESLPLDSTVKQMKHLRDEVDTDIGDIADYGDGANKKTQKNALDQGIESFQDYIKKNQGKGFAITPFKHFRKKS